MENSSATFSDIILNIINFSILQLCSLELYPTNLDKYWKSNDEFSNVALYDLSKDPSETTNLAKQYPDLVKELLAEAEHAIKDAPKQTFTMVNSL